MRIVHLCNYFQPELGYQEYFLAIEHAKMGHEVTVVTSERYFPFPDYENTTKPVLGNRIHEPGEYDLEGYRVIKLPVAFEVSKRVWLKGLERVLRRLRPDLVVCHGIGNFNALRVSSWKKSMGFKLLVDDHMLMSEVNRSILGKLYYKTFNFQKVYRSADRIVGVADECVQYIIDFYRYPKSRVEMIPLGADTNLFRFEKEQAAAFRKRNGIDEDAIVITYTGKHTFKKAPHYTLVALDQLRDKLGDKKIVALYVGNMEANYREELELHAAKVADRVKVIMLPAVTNKELVAIYSASDIASWPRQGSMSMIEACSCGVPIVCCDFLTERYKNNNGIAIKEDNMQDLINAYDFLINNEAERKAMGERSRELIMNEMSWKSIAERYLE